MAKGYSQIYGVDFHDTFSLVEKMASVWLLFTCYTSLDSIQLDIKNVVPPDILDESLYRATT